jgi:hypothetical protein
MCGPCITPIFGAGIGIVAIRIDVTRNVRELFQARVRQWASHEDATKNEDNRVNRKKVALHSHLKTSH